MRLLTTAALATALIALASPAFAIVGCADYVQVTPNNAARPYSAVVKAGSATSNGYSGVPGQNGCPIKAAAGTCPDAHASLSNKVDSYVGQFVAYDGNVADIYTHRKTILGFPVGPTLPGTCGS